MQCYLKMSCLCTISSFCSSWFGPVSVWRLSCSGITRQPCLSTVPASLHSLFQRQKAARTVLLLVSCFVFFYGTNSGLSIHMGSVYEKNLMPENITGFHSSCYPTVCAVVLIKYDNRVSRSTCAISYMIISACLQWRFLLHLKNTDKNDFNCRRAWL